MTRVELGWQLMLGVWRSPPNAVTLCLACACALATTTSGQQAQPRAPEVRLVGAPRVLFPGKVDSNTPVVWSLIDGSWVQSVVTSWAGVASISAGARLDRMPDAVAAPVRNHPGHGVWMESVVVDEGGVWYGFYHNEIPAESCGRPDRQVPRINAARSTDRGRSWEYLGSVIEAPPDSIACGSSNRFVVGGVGDVAAVLDHDRANVFLYFTQYARDPAAQGIAVGRLAWADRDTPTGKVSVWSNGAWLPARATPASASNPSAHWEYPVGSPLVPATQSWHDGGDSANAFWGASIHWNTYLQQWVMLVNRARDEQFNQDGFYIAFSSTLAEPSRWSVPRKIFSGGGWYAQVVGIEPREGTDTRAGQRARFFMTGRSQHFIEFSK